MIYGYIRVSSSSQNTARQVEKMQSLGITSLFIDHASGKDMERPEWQKLMAVVSSGDLIIIDSLDRLGRNYDMVTSEWRRLTREVGVDIKALDLDFMDSRSFKAMGSLGKVMEDNVLSLLAYVAQTEREKIKQRQAEGIAIAKSNGVYDHLKSTTFREDLVPEVMSLYRNRYITAEEAAKRLGISRRTFFAKKAAGELVA